MSTQNAIQEVESVKNQRNIAVAAAIVGGIVLVTPKARELFPDWFGEEEVVVVV